MLFVGPSLELGDLGVVDLIFIVNLVGR